MTHKVRKVIMGVGIAALIMQGSTKVDAVSHIVKSGDTLWKISQQYSISLGEIEKLNPWVGTVSYIDIGQVIHLSGKVLKEPVSNQLEGKRQHKVAPGDTLWNISEKYLVSIDEMVKLNPWVKNVPYLEVGQIIYIPEIVKIKNPVTSGIYGSNSDWFADVDKAIPRGAIFTVEDFYTKKQYKLKRTIGVGHADSEPLTLKDTEIMKSIWGGYSWNSRPSVVIYNGVRVAASISFMPHAGSDKAQGGVYTSWRSGNYGAGLNYDYVKGNGVDGHIDVHFRNSTRHVDGKIDIQHQSNIKIAAGIK